ncbi:MAG: GAF domain-containing sensor histidine kinase [Candidatus Dormiibacterota bacterium]
MTSETVPRVERPLPLARLFDSARSFRGDGEVMDRVAQLLADEGRRQLPHCETVISVVPWDRETEFQVVAGSGPWAESLVGKSWPIEGTVHELALRAEEPVELLAPADRSPFPEVFADRGIANCRLMPLVAGPSMNGRRLALGVFGFWSQRREPFSAEERLIVDNLGRLASLLLLQVEAWRTEERSENRLRLRRAIAEDVQTSLDTDDIVNRTVTHLLEISAADRVTLSTIDGDELRILFSQDGEGVPPWVGSRLPMSRVLSNPTVAKVIAERRPHRGGAFETAESSPFVSELGRALHTALIPLVIHQEVTGLVALTRRSGPPFSDDEMAELEIGASVAALALRNARLYDQAQAAAAARSAFLNLAAHELRTPFTVISGYLSLLIDETFGPAPGSWARPLSILRDKAAELGRLVDQILAASRAESDGYALDVEPIALSEAVQAAVNRVQSRVELNGGVVCLNVLAEPIVRADAAALSVVLDNLLNNAVNYRREPPRIQVTIHPVEPGRPTALVRVRDNGRGIAEADREHVFEQFYRGEDPLLNSTAGTGLGLYIARRMVEGMGGSLTLEWSEPDQGSEFALGLLIDETGPG